MLTGDTTHTDLDLCTDVDQSAISTFSGDDIIQLFGEFMGYSVVICDRDLNIIHSNSGPCTLLALPQDYVQKGRSIIPAIKAVYNRGDFGAEAGKHVLEQHIKEMRENLATNISTKSSWQLTQPDGRVVKITHVYTGKGNVVFLAKEHTQDRKRDDVLDMALSVSNSGYWTHSFADNTMFISEHLKSLFTEREQEIIKVKGVLPLAHPDDQQIAKKKYTDGIKSDAPFEFTLRLVLEKHGTIYFRTISKPEISTSGKPLGVTSFVSDITEVHKKTQEIESAKKLAQDTLVANNEFLAGMSHEIRTPMNGIVGMADALLHSGKCDNILPQLSVIKDSASNMLRLLDETLEHAKLSSGKVNIIPELNAPREMLSSLHMLWREKALENGNELKLHIDENLPEAFVFDRFRFEQCINNLVSNAVKFTQNGQIHIIAKVIGDVSQDKGLFALAVKDTGIGMTPEQQGVVFKPYEQADETISGRFGGTGLGMSICKDYIELMGGNIKLKSAINTGTTFILSLPLKGAQSPAETPQSAPTAKIAPSSQTDLPPAINPSPITRYPQAPVTAKQAPVMHENSGLPMPVTPAAQPRAKSLTAADVSSFTPAISQNDFHDTNAYKHLSVLVVEDNATNQVVVRALLEPIVGVMHFASNGVEALEILQCTMIDVILMDIHMPVMDGIETTLAIRSKDAPWKDICIIALTADPEYQQKRICKNIGMNDAIAKPVSRRDVLRAFDAALGETRAAKKAS